ncbi:hypothetical protein H0X48_06890, partial [Candidatus Dependentiae bacterium]|nr:hypothetical protein [Candidatus Dependentiae bacterium]
MNAGRELDRLVAIKIMDLEVVATPYGKKGYVEYSIGEPRTYYDRANGSSELHNPLPEYSSNIEAAFTIVEKLANEGLAFKLTGHMSFEATFSVLLSGTPQYRAETLSVPRSICLA